MNLSDDENHHHHHHYHHHHRPLEDIMQSLHHKSVRTLSKSNILTAKSSTDSSYINNNDNNKISNIKNIGISSIIRKKKTKITPENNNDNNDNSLNLTNFSVENRQSITILEQPSSKQVPIDENIQSTQSSFLITKTISIMIVDDSSMNRKIVRRTIEGYIKANVLNGYQVIIEEADDGITAIEKYKSITSNQESDIDLFVLGKCTFDTLL